MSSGHIVMLLDNPFSSDFRVQKEIETLTKNGFKVSVVATNEDQSLPQEEIQNGVYITRTLETEFSNPLRISPAFLKRVTAIIAKLQPDYLHCHDHLMYHLGAHYKQQFPKTRLIYDSHEYLAGYPLYKSSIGWLNKVKGYIVWKYMRHLENKHAHLLSAVITASKPIASRLREQMKLSCPVIALTNIPEKPTALVTSNYFHAFFQLDSDQLILVHTGNIYLTKHEFSRLADSVAVLKNVSLVFVCSPDRFEKFKSIAQDHSNVFHHDYFSKEDMVPHLAAADIGICHVPITSQSFILTSANRLYEYSLAGLPILSTKQQNCLELNEQFHHICFYEHLGSEEFVDTLQQMINDREKLSQNAAGIQEVVNWEIESKKLINLYQNLSVS